MTQSVPATLLPVSEVHGSAHMHSYSVPQNDSPVLDQPEIPAPPEAGFSVSYDGYLSKELLKATLLYKDEAVP